MAINPTILIVEDDPHDALFLQMALKRVGVANPAHVAVDGSQALDYLAGKGQFSDREQFPIPYLVFLDLKLPQMPGLEVLKWIREKPEFNTTVVLVLTSSSDPRDIDAAYQFRANAYLVKPSGLDGLTALLNSVKDFWLVRNQLPSVFSRHAHLASPAR